MKADTDDFQSQLKALQSRVEKKQEEALAKQESIDRAKESVETIMNDMAEITHQYIHHRLYHSKTGGLDYRRLSICQEYTSEIVKMGIEFENCYPSLFAEISKQLRYFLTTFQNLNNSSVDLADHKTITLVIQDFSENLFASKRINWFVIIRKGSEIYEDTSGFT